MSEQFEINAHVTPADLDAALAFIKKRARKRSDAVEGVSVALFAVMFATCEGLVDCGLSVENIDSLLNQFRRQITSKIQLLQTEGLH